MGGRARQETTGNADALPGGHGAAFKGLQVGHGFLSFPAGLLSGRNPGQLNFAWETWKAMKSACKLLGRVASGQPGRGQLTHMESVICTHWGRTQAGAGQGWMWAQAAPKQAAQDTRVSAMFPIKRGSQRQRSRNKPVSGTTLKMV